MGSHVVDHIVVVGGGTAGWLTAAKLIKRTQANSGSLKISVIESPDIPTIGVGEGTWPTMRKTLAELEINESDFMRNCSATFKQGTKFINWRCEATLHNNFYYHLFSSVFDPSEFNLAPYWLAEHANENRTYAETVSIQGSLCDLGLAPKKITTKPFDGIQNYAYHLDAMKFAELLKQYCLARGVQFIVANVTQVLCDEQGYISALDTDRIGQIAGDFFIDCSGFRSLLIGETLGIPFHSVNDILFNDSAIAIQVPYEHEDADIPCTTLSTAQQAGWIWDISLSSRRGTGHVYSSQHMSADEAETVLRHYIGPSAHALTAKHIKMNIGYREKFWHKNCVAIGMSAAFVEPLEASAIFLVEASGNMICDLIPRDRAAMAYSEQRFNASMLYRWQRTIDFIKLHYVLSQRQSVFWLDNKNPATIPDSLKASLAHWQHHPISKYEFASAYEPFPHESYQYVVYGMGLRPNLPSYLLGSAEQANEKLKLIQQASKRVVNELPRHRDLIKRVYQYGFQPI